MANIKNTFFGATLVIMALGIMIPQADASFQRKEAVIWGEKLSYVIETVKRNGVDYDGMTSVYKGPDGRPSFRLVLNAANLSREAQQLWEEFRKNPKPSQVKTGPLLPFIEDLGGMNRKIHDRQSFSLDQRKKMLTELKTLEQGLKYSAWYSVYESSSSRQDFVRQFVQIRLATIEFHELSHLLDEIKGERGKTKTASRDMGKFAHQTEVRAYLTEMAYGSNPQDVLWQVVSGVLQETREGKNTDYSIQKLMDTLQAASLLPEFKKVDAYVCLCKISRTHSYFLASRIYKVYQGT